MRTVTYLEVTDPGSGVMLGEVSGRAARAERSEQHGLRALGPTRS
jgi:hypothetical protein